MAFFRAFMVILLAGWLIGAAGQNHHHHLSGQATNNASLVAPYYRNVSVGEAWVLPNSVHDLGARDMRCECFNPDETCCMPKSNWLPPFCIPKGSVCCSDTFCMAGETCCADACCKSNTTCTSSGAAPGCCPHGKTCTGAATCYDFSMPNCRASSTASSCCIPRLPFCRNFSPQGLQGFGCYASSIHQSLVFGIPVTTVESDGPYVPTSGKKTVVSSTTVEFLTTVTETITLQELGYSATVTRTIPFLTTSTPISTSHEQTSPAPTATTTTTTTTTSSTTPISSRSTSHLCFNADSQSPVACTPSPSDNGPSLPGQTIFHSRAPLPAPKSLIFIILTHLLLPIIAPRGR